MALNETTTATGIVNRIQTLIDNASPGGNFDPALLTREDIWRETLTQIFSDIRDDILISTEIPIGAVIVSVAGGSGAPAVGLTNTSPISLTHTDTE